MKAGDQMVVATFSTADAAFRAIESLKQAGFDGGTVYSPVNSEGLALGTERRSTSLGWIALVGALVGASAGVYLTVQTSVQQGMITGGQPIVSVPPFIVIAFELTILFGVLATMLGMFWSLRRGRRAGVAYDSRYSMDRVGLEVSCSAEQLTALRLVLTSAGAEEVRNAEA